MVGHAWLVVACVTVTVLAALLYVAVAPRRYQAKAEMLVSPVSSTDTALVGLPVLHSSNDPTQDVLTAASLMTTPQVAQAVVSALHLHESSTDAVRDRHRDARRSEQPRRHPGDGGLGRAGAEARQQLRRPCRRDSCGCPARCGGSGDPRLASPGRRLADRQPQRTGNDRRPAQPARELAGHQRPDDHDRGACARPTGPYSPKTKLALLAALFGGLIIGIGAAFGWDALDPRLRREQQLRDLLGLPILAKIPRERPSRKGQPMLPQELSFVAAEGYRTLRAVLTSRAGGSPRAFLVTGSAPARVRRRQRSTWPQRSPRAAPE